MKNKINKKDIKAIFAKLPQDLALKLLIKIILKYADNKSGKSKLVKRKSKVLYGGYKSNIHKK